jgi:hypothetical protein
MSFHGFSIHGARLHASRQIEKPLDGRLRLSYYCGITRGVVGWMLSFGGDVVVQESEDLREAVVKEARRVLETVGAGSPAEGCACPGAGGSCGV